MATTLFNVKSFGDTVRESVPKLLNQVNQILRDLEKDE
jgi:hypothetical protein